MLFTTPTQLAVLGLLLVVGWLFGFASHPGGKRWRRAYEDEAVGRAQDRDELDTQLRSQDARIRTLEQEKAALAAELEQARGSRTAAEVVAPTAEVVDAAEPRPVYLSRIVPETPAVPAPAAVEPVEPAPAHEPIAQPAALAEPVVLEPEPAPVIEQPPIAAEYTEVAPAAPEAAAPEPLPIKRGWFDWGKSDDLSALRGVDAGLAERLKAEGVDSFAELGKLNDQEEIALERRLDLPAGYIMKEQLREQARLLADGQTEEHTSRFG